jgi:hypothetical protein
MRFEMLLVFAGVAVAPALHAEVETEMEAGYVFVGRNDARIPGDGGTKISFVDDLSTDPAPAFRVRLGYRFADRHLVTALYAPLALTSSGRVDRDILFDGGTYPAGTPILAVYRFDSYRLTYRYSFVRNEGLELAAGLTAKIRDAETSLYGADARSKTNTGFVPLLNLHVAFRPDGSPVGALLDADALVSPNGRAEDVLLALTVGLRDAVELHLGYRLLEGGADNDEVYSFALFHYAVMGLALTL